MNPQRRLTLQGLALSAFSATTLSAFGQTWPTRILRIVHGYESGANPDAIARVISPGLSERLGQQIIVEAKPGGAGRIATRYVAIQPADGYTMIMLTAGDAVLAALDRKLPYDLLKDFSFVSSVIESPLVLCVAADSPIKTLADLLAAAKRKPGTLTFGTPGIGTTQHMAGELLQSRANIELLHVPYKGNAFMDLIGGRVDFLIAAPSVAIPQIRGNKVRAIALTSKAPLATLPDVAPVAQILPDYDVNSWLGLALPAGTPAERIQRLSKEVQATLGTDAVRNIISNGGSVPAPSSGEAFRARIESDVKKWSTLSGRVKLES
jgi:tripartite-type tricarboxylate transporter receptor subunit TctC